MEQILCISTHETDLIRGSASEEHRCVTAEHYADEKRLEFFVVESALYMEHINALLRLTTLYFPTMSNAGELYCPYVVLNITLFGFRSRFIDLILFRLKDWEANTQQSKSNYMVFIQKNTIWLDKQSVRRLILVKKDKLETAAKSN